MSTPVRTQPVQVTRLVVHSEGSNSHGVSRREVWSTETMGTFPTEADAKQYIRDMHCYYSDKLVNLVQQWRETPEADRTVTRDELIDAFSFTNDQYLHHRRLFVGRPNFGLIRKHLQAEGVKTITG